jgi:hypothetical protein
VSTDEEIDDAIEFTDENEESTQDHTYLIMGRKLRIIQHKKQNRNTDITVDPD